MNAIRIAGRGVKVPTTEVHTDPEGVTIRVEDEDRPDFWLTVRISREQLIAMIDACNAADVAETTRRMTDLATTEQE